MCNRIYPTPRVEAQPENHVQKLLREMTETVDHMRDMIVRFEPLPADCELCDDTGCFWCEVRKGRAA